MQLLAVVLPHEGVVDTSIVAEAVGALAVVGLEDEVVGAGADNQAVVGAEGIGDLTLLGGGEGDILGGAVVVADGLQVGDALGEAGRHLAEVAAVADDARQLTRQGVERGVEDEAATVVAADALVGGTGRQQEGDEPTGISAHRPKSFRSASVMRSKWKPSSVCCMRASIWGLQRLPMEPSWVWWI